MLFNRRPLVVGSYSALTLYVEEEHLRKGLASALTVYVEGDPMARRSMLTLDGIGNEPNAPSHQQWSNNASTGVAS